MHLETAVSTRESLVFKNGSLQLTGVVRVCYREQENPIQDPKKEALGLPQTLNSKLWSPKALPIEKENAYCIPMHMCIALSSLQVVD